jgi:hypothetical protein
MLSVCDSQFSQSVQTAFKQNLTVDSGFLVTYLAYLHGRAGGDDSSAGVRAYVQGILAASLCAIADVFFARGQFVPDRQEVAE